MLSKQLQLFDHFQGNSSSYNISRISSPQELTNAVLYLKNSVIKLYHNYMPLLYDSNPGKQKGLGTFTKIILICPLGFNSRYSCLMYILAATSNYRSSRRARAHHQHNVLSVTSILSGVTHSICLTSYFHELSVQNHTLK